MFLQTCLQHFSVVGTNQAGVVTPHLQRLELLFHSQKVLGFDPADSLSVWVSSASAGFLQQSEDAEVNGLLEIKIENV